MNKSNGESDDWYQWYSGGHIIFSTSGERLAIAGRAGALAAFAALGVVTISFIEGLSEMIELCLCLIL